MCGFLHGSKEFKRILTRVGGLEVSRLGSSEVQKFGRVGAKPMDWGLNGVADVLPFTASFSPETSGENISMIIRNVRLKNLPVTVLYSRGFPAFADQAGSLLPIVIGIRSG